MIRYITLCAAAATLFLNLSCSTHSLNNRVNPGYGKYMARRTQKEKMEDEENEKNAQKMNVKDKENEKAIKDFNERAQYKNPDKE